MTVALVATAAVALWNWSTRLQPEGSSMRWQDNVSKPLATVLVMWVALAANGATAPTVLCLVALVWCLAGDVALLESIDRFVVGLACFLVGHVVFVAMFAVLGFLRPWLAAIAVAVIAPVAAGPGRRIVAGATAEDPALRVPVMAYLTVISAMGVAAAATGRMWAIVGAASFVLSDSLLGWGAFVRRHRWTSLAVMVTYHVALVALALSLR